MTKHKMAYAVSALVMTVGVGVFGSSGAQAEGTCVKVEDVKATEEKNVCVASYGELYSALLNKNIEKVVLTEDIEATGYIAPMHGVTIEGDGHTITETGSTYGIWEYTPEPVVLSNLKLVNKVANGYGVYIGKGLSSYDLTITGSTISSNGYGIYDAAGYFGATGDNLKIENSKISWVDKEGNGVKNVETDLAANTGLTSGYSYGIYSYGMKDSKIDIAGSEISGYRYVSTFVGDASGGALNIDGSYLAGRSNIDIMAKATEDSPFMVTVSDSELHGINLYGGASEDYANVLFGYNNDGVNYAVNAKAKFTDVKFTVYENETALNGASAGQYAITNRTADVAGSNNTAEVYGESSYLVPDEYKAAKAGQTNSFLEDWVRPYIGQAGYDISAAGITVYGGAYSYDPTEFVAKGMEVYLTDDGYVVVDDETLAEENSEYVDEDGDGVYELMPIEVDLAEAEVLSSTGDVAGNAKIGKTLMADRKAKLRIAATDIAELGLDAGKADADLVKAFDIEMLDRDGAVIPVSDNEVLVTVALTDDEYEALAEYDKVVAIYFDEGSEAEERIEAELSGEAGSYWAKFTAEHFSTYGIAGVNEATGSEATTAETETEGTETAETADETTDAASPETGTVTREGGSAMAASMVTAVAVGVISAVTGLVAVLRRR